MANVVSAPKEEIEDALGHHDQWSNLVLSREAFQMRAGGSGEASQVERGGFLLKCGYVSSSPQSYWHLWSQVPCVRNSDKGLRDGLFLHQCLGPQLEDLNAWGLESSKSFITHLSGGLCKLVASAPLYMGFSECFLFMDQSGLPQVPRANTPRKRAKWKQHPFFFWLCWVFTGGSRGLLKLRELLLLWHAGFGALWHVGS